MGIPSPRKTFWVISIQGAFVRIEGVRRSQLEVGPTPFLTEKEAMSFSRHIWVGESHFVHLTKVNRSWLESVARGETKVKVQVFRPTSAR